MSKIKCFVFAFLAIIYVSCDPDDSIRFPLASGQNIDNELLEEAYDEANQMSGLKSLLVSRNGVLVAEDYFTDMGAEDLYHTRSVTKSVVSALIGIAVEEGFIQNTDQKLSDYLSPLGYSLEGEKSDITIEHLLTMSAGFEWNEFTDNYSYVDWIRADDQIEYCIEGDLVYSPGERFGYSSEEVHLLSVILTEATGMSTHDFAFEYFFEPLEWE